MLLKQADVGLGFRSLPSSGGTGGADLDCDGLDESDLTVTGNAHSPYFTSDLQRILSAARIFISVRDANMSWRRSTGAGGFKCLKDIFRRDARTAGVRFVSFRKVPFPALAPRTAAYRAQDQASGVRVYEDLILLTRGRVQAVLIFISAIDPLERSEALRLTRFVSNRMAKAIRGS
jgi:hypothetical protein